MKLTEHFQDSALASGLRTAWDLLILNFLWLMCCIPVITIGPATCALFSTAMKLARDESTSVFHDFFRAVIGNFWQGLLLGVVAAGVAVVSFVDGLFAMQQTGLFKIVFMTASTLAALLFLIILCYVFPLQARFQGTMRMHLRNGCILPFKAPGKTLLIWLIVLTPAALAFLFPAMMLQTLGIVYILAGASLPVYLDSKILNKLFDEIGTLSAPTTAE